MLVESGFVKATTGDGREFTFSPSLGRIASLGSPHEIVALYAGLHGQNAAKEATYVLACLCDQEDVTALIGGKWICKEAPPVRTLPWWKFWAGQIYEPTPPDRWIDEEIEPLMPPSEQILIAQHLMKHGMVGKAKPSKGDGQYSDKFDAAEYIAAARVHLGLSSADAEALSMTEFQTMFEMKFPQQGEKTRDVASREEYEAGMAKLIAIRERKRG